MIRKDKQPNPYRFLWLHNQTTGDEDHTSVWESTHFSSPSGAPSYLSISKQTNYFVSLDDFDRNLAPPQWSGDALANVSC